MMEIERLKALKALEERDVARVAKMKQGAGVIVD
jgi:hypothetical protein